MSEDEEIREVEISIEPRAGRLEELGVSLDEFEEALNRGLDEYHDLIEGLDGTDLDAHPSLDEATIILNGQPYALGDIAEIEIHGDQDDL